MAPHAPAELPHAALHLAARAFVTTVLGDDAATSRHYRAALAAAVSPAALAEIARMAHLFCGFPRAIQGLRQLEEELRGAARTDAARGGGGGTGAGGDAGRPVAAVSSGISEGVSGVATSESSRASLPPTGATTVTDPEPPRSRAEDRARGATLFRAIYGSASDAVLARLDAVAIGFSAWVLEDAYGRVLSRAGLSARQRELLAIAALTALDCPAQLKSHLRGALRLGARPEEVTALLASLADVLPAETLARTAGELARTR